MWMAFLPTKPYKNYFNTLNFLNFRSLTILSLKHEGQIKKEKLMTISQAQQEVDQWIKKNGVRYFNELTNMVILTEEVGELARILARRYGEQSEKESDKNKDLGDEMADVLWVLI